MNRPQASNRRRSRSERQDQRQGRQKAQVQPRTCPPGAIIERRSEAMGGKNSGIVRSDIHRHDPGGQGRNALDRALADALAATPANLSRTFQALIDEARSNRGRYAGSRDDEVRAGGEIGSYPAAVPRRRSPGPAAAICTNKEMIVLEKPSRWSSIDVAMMDAGQCVAGPLPGQAIRHRRRRASGIVHHLDKDAAA